MTGWSRRALLAGAALSALPLRAASDEAQRLRDVLDTLPQGDPAAALRRLEPFEANRLPPVARRDLETVRAGLLVDYTLPSERTKDRSFAGQVARRVGTVRLPQLRQRLERERAQLSAKADTLLRRPGLSDGSVGARYRRLFADPRWHYPDDERGRVQAVADMNRWLATWRAVVSAAFDDVPAWCRDVSVRSLSPAEVAAGKGGYRELPEPGKPGAYVVDLKEIARRPRWSLPSVVAHELLPGHMIQLPIEAAAKPHPLRLVYASAFPEGWAIYAEQLAGGQGAFADPLDRLGHLHWLLFRVCRALVDIAIHVDGWSTERAHDALREWQGEPAYFAPFATDLGKIVAEPGAKAAEAAAWLAIADHAPRDPVCWKAFHTSLLAAGRKRVALP